MSTTDTVDSAPLELREQGMTMLWALVDDLRNEKQHLVAELDRSRDEVRELYRRMTAKDATIQDKIKLLAEYESERAATKEREATLDAIAQKLAGSASEAAQMKAELKATKSELAQAARNLESTKQKLARKTEDHDEAVSLLHRRQDELNIHRADAENCRRELNRYTSENSALREKADNANLAAKRVEEQLRRNLDEQERQRRALEAAEEELAKARQPGAPAQDAAADAAVDLDALRRHLDSAWRYFEDEPEKALRALSRARVVAAASEDTVSEQEDDS